jgi:hypothetical protein
MHQYNLCALVCCAAFLSFISDIPAQSNLVPNGSFETYTACPNNIAQVHYTGNWSIPNKASTDYFNTCSNMMMGVPTNWAGTQPAMNSGSSYMGVITWLDSSLWREYLQTRLTNSLSAGQTYYVSFYVALADSSTMTTDDIGAFFSATAISMPSSYANFSVTPQVANPQGLFLNNLINWTKISGSFVASGGEEYVTIGNFSDDASTSLVRRQPAQRMGDFAYYYIDEVCLSTNPQTCNADINLGFGAPHLSNQFFYYSLITQNIIFENNEEPITVAIFDLFGSCIKKTAFTTENRQLNVSDIVPGCYLVRTYTRQGDSVKKIVIN